MHSLAHMHMEAEQHMTVGFQFTQASRPTNEQPYIEDHQTTSCTNQRVIIVMKGEISSVECCLWSERASLGTSDLGFAA